MVNCSGRVDEPAEPVAAGEAEAVELGVGVASATAEVAAGAEAAADVAAADVAAADVAAADVAAADVAAADVAAGALDSGVVGVVLLPEPEPPPMVKSMHDSYVWSMDAASQNHWMMQSPLFAHSALTSGIVMSKLVHSGCSLIGLEVSA